MANVIVNSLLIDAASPGADLKAGQTLAFDAGSIRALIRQLDRQFPGMAAKLESNTAVAIDGEIYPDPLLESLDEESEVYFLPAIKGG